MNETLTDAVPVLNLGHDQKLFADVFRKYGRIHIPNVLTADSAARIYRCLVEETAYNLVINNKDETYDLSASDLATLSKEKAQSLIDAATAGARTGFQFIYGDLRMSHNGEAFPDPNHYLAKIVDFLNSNEFLTFVRSVTGLREIAFADAQATRYGVGHFLTQHDDNVKGKKRLAAYVLSMTPRWRVDWGGILQFIGSDNHVIEGYTPAFNALNLLRVPQAHLVSQVASYAGGARYSITGWLRAR